MPRAYFVCTYENCSATFRSSAPYDGHLRTHSGERPFVCVYDDCDKSYTRLSHLKRHEETHESIYRCDYPNCSKILMSKPTLQKHVNVVHLKNKSKSYKCSVCDQEFNKHNWLTAHMYSHTGIKPYVCPEPNCDRRFLMPCKLKQHLKYHKGYLCDKDNCGKIFSKWSLLRRHIKECHPPSHKCPSCDKVFCSTSNLKQHSLVHKEEREIFKCPVPKCIRFYMAKRHLAEHLRNFHEERSYSCPKEDCHIFCKTEGELVKHINRRHMPRTKKPVHPKPSFAEILACFAKGTKKDLNPHLSSAFKSNETSKDLVELTDVEDISDTGNSVTTTDVNDISSAQNYAKHLNSCLFNTSKPDETHEQLFEISNVEGEEINHVTEDTENNTSVFDSREIQKSDETCKELLESLNMKDKEKCNVTYKDAEYSKTTDCINEISIQNYISSKKDAWNRNNLRVKKLMCNVLA